MSSSMTPMEVGVLLVEFSAVPTSERTAFLRQHPGLQSAWVIDWALMAARLRGKMGEPEAQARLASAAMCLAAELGDHERQAAARELLAERIVQAQESESFPTEIIPDEAHLRSGTRVVGQESDDHILPPRHIPQRTRSLAASGAALSERPSLGTAIRLMLRHPRLMFPSLKLAARFVGAAIRDPMSAMAELEREMAETVDQASLSRLQNLARRARQEGDEETAQHLERLPASIAELHGRFSSSLSKAFALEVFDLFSAVAAAKSETHARRIARRQIRLALNAEFLPVLMQVREFCSQPPDPLPHVDAYCALILEEVGHALSEMDPQAVGVGGLCTALRLADSPQALQECLLHYAPLVDDGLPEELEQMSKSAEERGLCDFADQTRLLAEMIRHYASGFDEGPSPLTLDAQTLSLLRVSSAETEDEVWAVVEEEPGLLSEDAIRQLRAQAAFQERLGDWMGAGRLRRSTDWLARWRSELADPGCNIVSRLADRVGAGELTLEEALAELGRADTLVSLTEPHLGAVDERVIELRGQDLHRAEILAVLNHTAARRVGGARIRAYAAISLAEVRISRGAAQPALPVLEDATGQAREIADPRLELRILGALGTAHQQLGQFREAEAVYQRARDLARKIGPEADQMPCLSNLAHIYSVLGDIEQASTCAQEGYGIACRIGDRHSQATLLGTMALLLERTGQFREAAEQFEQALQAFRDLGDRHNEAKALGNLGSMYMALGELQQAREFINESLTLAQRIGLRSLEMNSCSRLADMDLMEGRLQRAIGHIQQTLAITVEIGDKQAEAMALNNLGIVYTRLNRWDQAGQYLETARQIAQQIGDRRLEGRVLLNHGNNDGARNLWIPAIDRYNAALNVARETQDRHLETQALGNLSRGYEHQGYFQAALDKYEQVLEPYRDMGNRQGEAITLNNMANGYTGLGQFDQALAHYQRALSIARDLGNPDLLARILAGRGHCHDRMACYAEACSDYRESIAHIEAIRGSLFEEEHRLSYFGWDKTGIYRNLILILADRCRRWEPCEALETVERSRSRGLLDQLSYTELPITCEVDPVLLTRERESGRALQERAIAVRQAKTEEQRQELVGQIATLQAQWNEVLDQMQELAPEYVALRRGEPAAWKELRRCLRSM